MSEVQTRPPSAPRGRGSSRGGRGGSSFGSRGEATNRGTARNNTTNGDLLDTVEDQGEVGQLKKQYANQLPMLKEMFPDWTAEDIVFALEENQGDLETTVSKITEGVTPQWGEVKKKNKDRARSKVKETPSTGAKDESFQSTRTRGNRTFDGTSTRGGRGGRGGSEHRGGRGGRGRGGVAANGVSRSTKDRANDSSAAAGWGETTTTTADDGNWGAPDADGIKNEDDGSGAATEATEKPTVPAAKTSTATPAPATKGSWASLLKPAPPPVPVKPQQKPVASPVPALPEPAEEPTPKETAHEEPAQSTPEDVSVPVQPEPEPEVSESPTVEATEEEPQQPLTEDNLDKIEDVAPPAPTGTAASTANTTIEKISETAQTTVPAVPIASPQTAPKHTGLAVPKGTPGRPSSFTRRVLDQQEGVVMPSNHAAVDRTALQFGSMGLNGDLDEDDEVEQAETVSQPPQPSPLAQPVTSLPPTGPSQLPAAQPVSNETIPTPRQAPGLPTQPQSVPQQTLLQPPVAPQSMTQQQVHPQMVNQYGRYGGPEQQAKPFETFGQPVQQQQAAPQPPTQPQQPPSQHPQQPQGYSGYIQPHQQQQPSHLGIGVSSAPDQHYNFYSEQRTQPPGFGMYNNSYMHAQQAQSQQEAGAAQQRAASGLSGAGEPSGQLPSSASMPGQVQQPTSRYGAQGGEQNSAHGTPSPAMPTVQQTSQPQQQYPTMQYHPYYSQFMHQVGDIPYYEEHATYPNATQNYYNGPSPFSKGLYTYPQGAYMSPQYSDHSSSPAGMGGFGAPSSQARDGMGVLNDYGRMNTSGAQQSLPQHSTAGAYGNGIPNFLNSRGLPQEQQQLGGASGQQPGQQGQNDDTLKFGENKPPPTGPSSTPGLQGQPGRPGSATSGASGLGPQQSGQGPAGMYGSHLNPNLHGHQGQQSGYGTGQGQNASHYSMYSGAYPSQYPQQGAGRHGGGTGWSYSH